MGCCASKEGSIVLSNTTSSSDYEHEYEDAITLEPIPRKDMYLLRKRYYDIKSLYKYITTTHGPKYVPHTMEPLNQQILLEIKHHYKTIYPNENIHPGEIIRHQRFYVRPIQKHTCVHSDYFIPDEPLPVGTLFYDKRDGRVRTFRCDRVYEPGDKIFYLQPAAYTSLHFPIPSSPDIVATRDLLGYSLPCDQ